MESPDIDKLLGEIREQVRLRRISGDYPPGLEEQLEREFQGIVNRERRDWTAVRDQLERRTSSLTQAFGAITGVTDVNSRFPGGSLVHRAVRKLVRRQTQGLANQIQLASQELVELVRVIAELQMAQEDADRRLVIHLSKNVMERLAVIDHLAIVVRDLERRVGN